MNTAGFIIFHFTLFNEIEQAGNIIYILVLGEGFQNNFKMRQYYPYGTRAGTYP